MSTHLVQTLAAFILAWVPVQAWTAWAVYDTYQEKKHDYPPGQRLNNVNWFVVFVGPILLGVVSVGWFALIMYVSGLLGGVL